MKNVTTIQINAVIALLVLALMFAGISVLQWWTLLHVESLGCAATEVLVGQLGLQISCVGGTVWVVKKFAESNGDKE